MDCPTGGMGLGSTAKKIQGLSDKAEQMYAQVQDLQQRIIDLEKEVDDTHDTVKRLDHRVEEDRALLLAIAGELDIDGEAVLAEAAIEDPEEVADDEAETESEAEAAAED